MSDCKEAEKISSPEVQADVNFQIQLAKATGQVPRIDLSAGKIKKGICDYDENEPCAVQIVGC